MNLLFHNSTRLWSVCFSDILYSIYYILIYYILYTIFWYIIFYILYFLIYYILYTIFWYIILYTLLQLLPKYVNTVMKVKCFIPRISLPLGHLVLSMGEYSQYHKFSNNSGIERIFHVILNDDINGCKLLTIVIVK